MKEDFGKKLKAVGTKGQKPGGQKPKDNNQEDKN